MPWFTALLIAGYIGICEVRAPNAWQACEGRWNWALGVLVPSPLPALGNYLSRQQQAAGRRRSSRRQRSSEPSEPDQAGENPSADGRSGGDGWPSA